MEIDEEQEEERKRREAWDKRMKALKEKEKKKKGLAARKKKNPKQVETTPIPLSPVAVVDWTKLRQDMEHEALLSYQNRVEEQRRRRIKK